MFILLPKQNFIQHTAAHMVLACSFILFHTDLIITLGSNARAMLVVGENKPILYA